MNPNRTLIENGRPFVLAVAGGGAEVFGDLLRHGGMSGTLLRGHVLQATDATDLFLGRKPEKYASGRTARLLAMRSFEEARGLGGDHAFGVGATSSLVKPGGEREGRKHEVYVAVQTADLTSTLTVELKSGLSRTGQEMTVAALIDRMCRLQTGRGLYSDIRRSLCETDTALLETTVANDFERDVVLGHAPYDLAPGPAVLSSSCDPLHEGHLRMMEWATQEGYGPVDVELCVRNADKPPLDYAEIRRRREETSARWQHGRVVLSNLPTFAEKAKAFPHTTFLVGWDTLQRIGDPRFYGGVAHMNAAFDAIGQNECCFLVFRRPGVDLPIIPRNLWDLCINAVDCESIDISSTEIRNESHAQR